MTASPEPKPTDLLHDPLLRDAPVVEGFKVLDPAVLYARVGQGGMGTVYRGRHFKLDLDVAVKCLKPSLAAEDPSFIKRFEREARLAGSIAHQNVVRVMDVQEKAGLHYLVMEFVRGETARERVQRKGPLGEQEALAILLGTATGLAEAHQRDIVHRDIKPDNVMISLEGRVKLADLGLAKSTGVVDGVSLSMQPSGVMGTPQYMPPEQWESPNVGPTADVWALGATFYYLLIGKNAIPSGSPGMVARRIQEHDFPSMRAERPDLRPEVHALFERCVRRKSEERFADARDLLRAVRRLASDDEDLLRDPNTGTANQRIATVTPPPRHMLLKIRTAVETAVTIPADELPTVPSRQPKPIPPTELSQRVRRRWIGPVAVMLALMLAAIGALEAFGVISWFGDSRGEFRSVNELRAECTRYENRAAALATDLELLDELATQLRDCQDDIAANLKVLAPYLDLLDQKSAELNTGKLKAWGELPRRLETLEAAIPAAAAVRDKLQLLTDKLPTTPTAEIRNDLAQLDRWAFDGLTKVKNLGTEIERLLGDAERARTGMVVALENEIEEAEALDGLQARATAAADQLRKHGEEGLARRADAVANAALRAASILQQLPVWPAPSLGTATEIANLENLANLPKANQELCARTVEPELVGWWDRRRKAVAAKWGSQAVLLLTNAVASVHERVELVNASILTGKVDEKLYFSVGAAQKEIDDLCNALGAMCSEAGSLYGGEGGLMNLLVGLPGRRIALKPLPKPEPGPRRTDTAEYVSLLTAAGAAVAAAGNDPETLEAREALAAVRENIAKQLRGLEATPQEPVDKHSTLQTNLDSAVRQLDDAKEALANLRAAQQVLATSACATIQERCSDNSSTRLCAGLGELAASIRKEALELKAKRVRAFQKLLGHFQNDDLALDELTRQVRSLTDDLEKSRETDVVADLRTLAADLDEALRVSAALPTWSSDDPLDALIDRITVLASLMPTRDGPAVRTWWRLRGQKVVDRWDAAAAETLGGLRSALSETPPAPPAVERLGRPIGSQTVAERFATLCENLRTALRLSATGGNQFRFSRLDRLLDDASFRSLPTPVPPEKTPPGWIPGLPFPAGLVGVQLGAEPSDARRIYSDDHLQKRLGKWVWYFPDRVDSRGPVYMVLIPELELLVDVHQVTIGEFRKLGWPRKEGTTFGKYYGRGQPNPTLDPVLDPCPNEALAHYTSLEVAREFARTAYKISGRDYTLLTSGQWDRLSRGLAAAAGNQENVPPLVDVERTDCTDEGVCGLASGLAEWVTNDSPERGQHKGPSTLPAQPRAPSTGYRRDTGFRLVYLLRKQ